MGSGRGRVEGGIGVPQLARAARVLGLSGVSFRRHGTRSPVGFSGDVGVLYVGGSGEDGGTPVLRVAMVCPASPSEEVSEAEYLRGCRREAVGAAMEVVEAETAYYGVGPDRDEAYRGARGRGARMGQHFGPPSLRRSPVLGLLACEWDIEEELVERLSVGEEGEYGQAVVVAHRGGLRFSGGSDGIERLSPASRGGSKGVHAVLLSVSASNPDGDIRKEAPYLARKGREKEYEALQRALSRPGPGRVARALLACRPERANPLTASNIAERLPEYLPVYPPEASRKWHETNPDAITRITASRAQDVDGASDAHASENAYYPKDFGASDIVGSEGVARRGIVDSLAAAVGVADGARVLVRAMGAAGFLTRAPARGREYGGALWMSAKMRADTASALARAVEEAISGGRAGAPGTVVCVPAKGGSREEWLEWLRGFRGAGGAESGLRLAFSGPPAAAALLSGTALEAPASGEPVRIVGGVEGGEGYWRGDEALAEEASGIGLEVLDVAEEEGYPEEAVLLEGYPDPGVLIDARREERELQEGRLLLASPVQMLVDLLLHPGDCEADYLEGIKSALTESYL